MRNDVKMESKKAQGLPLNIVIVAALVLIVLVVLVVIFTGRTQRFTEGTKEVETQYKAASCEIPGTSRKCMAYDGTANQCPDGRIYIGVMDCQEKYDPNYVCCQ